MSSKLSKQSEIVDVSKFFSPTFNIHIHVPHYNTNSPNIYLPRIQPVIHLHLDKVAKKLVMNQNEKSEEFWGKVLLPMASPKFGNVKFHFEEKSGGSSFEISNETSCSTRNQCNDSQLRKGKDKEKAQLNASKRSKVVCEKSDIESTPIKDFKNISNEMLLSKYKDLNLKKAVVVLTDICKSKTWKNIERCVINDSEKSQNENTYSEPELDKNDEYGKHEKFQIKQENESFSPPSDTFYKSHIMEDTLENNGGFIKLEEIIVDKSTVQDMVAGNENLTALVEGCNFSEILNRFRAEVRQYNGNTAKKPAECHVRPKNNLNKNCFNKITTSATNLEDSNCDSYSGIDRIELEFDKNMSAENKSSFQIRGNTFNAEKENFVRGSDEETVEFEFPSMSQNKTDTKSDKVNFTLERHSSAEEAVVDSGTLEFNSSFEISSDQEGEFEVSEKHSASFDVGDVDFHLQLIQKEMKRRSQINSQKNKNIISKPGRNSDPGIVISNKSSPPKKVKLSDKTSSSSPAPPASSSTTEDYIPLNASGSTRFAVVPLDKIQPYKTHTAKNFKKEMLFGNRVTRFSSSEKLRIYQIQKAVRKSIKKQEK